MHALNSKDKGTRCQQKDNKWFLQWFLTDVQYDLYNDFYDYFNTDFHCKDSGPAVTMISSDLYALQFFCTDVYIENFSPLSYLWYSLCYNIICLQFINLIQLYLERGAFHQKWPMERPGHQSFISQNGCQKRPPFIRMWKWPIDSQFYPSVIVPKRQENHLPKWVSKKAPAICVGGNDQWIHKAIHPSQSKRDGIYPVKRSQVLSMEHTADIRVMVRYIEI